MPATSQNGWPAYNETSHFVREQAAGLSFWAANLDVAYVAKYLIERFHAEVERIDGKTLDDWSWANRNVRGSATSVSNHASATAWDLNALKHGRGAKGTFTKAQEAAVNTILDAIIDDRGTRVFRWGEDYTTTVDGMHFEINVPAASVKQARARLERNLTEKEEAEDMDWNDDIKLTPSDAEIWSKHSGQVYKAGALVKLGTMLRYPTLARRLDIAVTAQGKQLTAQAKEIAALKADLAAVKAQNAEILALLKAKK